MCKLRAANGHSLCAANDSGDERPGMNLCRALPSPQRGLEVLGMTDPKHGLGSIDRATCDELREAFLDGERPVLARDRDLLMEMLQRVAAYVLPRTVLHHQQLGGGKAAGTGRHQCLDEHGGERGGDL